MVLKEPTSSNLAARAHAIASHARDRAESDRERNRRECPELAAFVDEYRHMGKCTFAICGERVFGRPAIDRIRDSGGKGIAVVASRSCVPGKPLKVGK